MTIIGKVFTNLDNYIKEIWPDLFVEVPKIGSRIKSDSGKILKVVGITHCIETSILGSPYPYIEIEVNK